MMHPLEAKIWAVRRRVRWWLVLEALARLGVWLVAGSTIFALADYWFRFQEPGLRGLLSLGFFVWAAWAVYQLATSPAWRRISEVGLALWLERYFPQLADRLASSIAFLRQSAEDPTAGSPALRQLLIAQTVQEAEKLDFFSALDPRPVRRMLWLAGGMFLVVGSLVLMNPASARIALSRLVMPFSETRWPQRTHLILVHQVAHLVRGQPFELLVEEAEGNLPADLRIHYRLETPQGIRTESEPIRLIPLRTETGQWKQVGQVRREGLLEPFWYRVTGGDDISMPWIRVEVVEAPRLVSCQVRLIPPEYSGLPEETAGQWIRALVGTRVEITGRANRPLRAAVLVADRQQEHQAQLAKDGYSFRIGGVAPAGAGEKQPLPKLSGDNAILSPIEKDVGSADSPPLEAKGSCSQEPRSQAEAGGGLVIRESGRWGLRLVAQEGLEYEAASWEVRAVPDLPPSLTLLAPPALSYATASAQLPIQAKVKDDLGIRQVVLWASTSPPIATTSADLARSAQESSGPPGQEKPPVDFRPYILYQGPSQPPRQPHPFSAGGDLNPKPLLLEYPWQLSTLQAQPGSEILFYLQASDYAGQTVSCQHCRIVVLSPEQFLERLTAQKNALIQELGQWLQQQNSVRDQLAELQKRWAEGEKLGQQQLDRLRSLELAQRQLHDQLTQSSESILARISGWLEDLHHNQLTQTELERRLEYLRRGLKGLEEEHLLSIDQKFIYAMKTAQATLETTPAKKTLPPPQPLMDSLAQILQHQLAIIQRIEAWLRRFQPHLQIHRFSREVALLIQDQQSLLGQICRTAKTTLGKELQELGPQELADLRSASQRQSDLAHRMQQLQQEMTDTLAHLQTTDPLAEHQLTEAVQYAQQTGLAARMADATQDILQNQMGRLLQTLPQLVQHLEQLAQLLGEQEIQTLRRSIPQWEAAEQSLLRWIKKQDEIQSLLKLAPLAKPHDRLALLDQGAKDQEALRGEVETLWAQMEQLWAPRPAQALRSALEAMEETIRSAQQGDSLQAIQSAQAALEALQQAHQLVVQERLQLHQALLAQFRQALPSLQQEQHSLWQATGQLEDVRKTTGTFSPQDRIHLNELARRQKKLQDQLSWWAEKLGDLPVLPMAVAEIARWMQEAACQLSQTQTTLASQAQQEALSHIQLLREALRQEAPSAEEAKRTPSPDQRPSGSSGARKVVSAVELRLLRLWQQAIYERTVAFHQTFGDQPPEVPQVQAQYQALRQAQARLAQMVEQILQPVSSPEAKP